MAAIGTNAIGCGGRQIPQMGRMLSIDQARAAVLADVHALAAEAIPIGDALGRVLAEDVTAAADVPGFANSAMDGFAVSSGPTGRRLRIAGESRAGAPAAHELGEERRSASRPARCCPAAPTR